MKMTRHFQVPRGLKDLLCMEKTTQFDSAVGHSACEDWLQTQQKEINKEKTSPQILRRLICTTLEGHTSTRQSIKLNKMNPQLLCQSPRLLCLFAFNKNSPILLYRYPTSSSLIYKGNIFFANCDCVVQQGPQNLVLQLLCPLFDTQRLPDRTLDSLQQWEFTHLSHIRLSALVLSYFIGTTYVLSTLAYCLV